MLYEVITFIEKPLSMGKLLATVDRALQGVGDEQATSRRGEEPQVSIPIGRSALMRQLRDDIERIAATDSWVLISGEEGCGKIVAARYLHQKSARSNQPLAEISFAALPAKEIAPQLFGRQEASETHIGALERANA